MEERLLKLLDIEQLSSSKFADVIGVQRSSVSHILSGRNKPSFDFLQKTLKAFPYLNAEWLILGEGKMYAGDDRPAAGNLFEQQAITSVIQRDVSQKIETEERNNDLAESHLESPDRLINESSDEIDKSEESKNYSTKMVNVPEKFVGRILLKVILLYSDNSFETFNPVE